MKQLCLPLVLLMTASLAGCSSNQKGAEAVVRDALKDPDSARFGEFYFNEKTKKGCLAVNAKNSMGGYTGDQQALVQRSEDGWEEIGISEIPLSSCRKIFADRVD